MYLPFAILACLTAAPFLMLPAILASKSRSMHARAILVCNALLGAWIVAGIVSLSIDTQTEYADVFAPRHEPMFSVPPISLAVIAWVTMLGFAVRKARPAASSLDETVELVPSHPSWPLRFEAERQRLCGALELPAASVEHIGSTAVPDLPAKPIVDVMLGVLPYPPTPDLLTRLGILGYEDIGEAGVSGRWYLRGRGEQAFNLHVVQRDGAHWANNLAVRELLRRDADARTVYAEAKRAALAAGGAKLLAYSAAKEPAIAALIAKARG